MRSLSMELVAAGGNLAVGIGPLIIGVLLVIGSIVARVLYIRRKRTEPPVPANPQPRAGAWETHEEIEDGHCPSNHGPGHQEGPPDGRYENVSREPEPVEPFDEDEPAEEEPVHSRTRHRRGGRRTPYQVRHYQGPRT